MTLLRGRLKIYIEPVDIWIGVYIGEDYVYVCPLPCLVFRWARALASRNLGPTHGHAVWTNPRLCHDCNTHAEADR